MRQIESCPSQRAELENQHNVAPEDSSPPQSIQKPEGEEQNGENGAIPLEQAIEELIEFQPAVHQLYDEELFPELEFSRKQSENSQLDAPNNESSFSLPKFEVSDDEEKANSQQYYDRIPAVAAGQDTENQNA